MYVLPPSLGSYCNQRQIRASMIDREKVVRTQQQHLFSTPHNTKSKEEQRHHSIMAMNTYLFRKKWLSLGDDFVINSTDEDGEGVAYTVDNKILRLRETYHFNDADGK